MEGLPFEMRYLVEALVTHGKVILPEVDRLMRCLDQHRFTDSDKIGILEGLFIWTRRGDIDADIRRESSIL